MSVHSTPAGRTDQAAAARVGGSAGPVRSDAEIAGRVDALIAQMSVAEKARQLTQYFYFNLPPSEDVETTLHVDFSRQPAMVEAALAEGRSGRCCSSPTRRR